MGKITTMQILYLWMQWKPHSCILKYERQFWHKVQSMVLKIFICPSHIANWSLGLLESMGCDRHPIRALGSFHYQTYLHMFNQCQTILKWASRKTTFRHNLYIGVYGKYPQVDRRKIKRWSIYWDMHPSIGNTWAPVKIRDIIRLLCRLGIDPYIILARLKQGVRIDTKEMGTNQALLLHPCKTREKQLILE